MSTAVISELSGFLADAHVADDEKIDANIATLIGLKELAQKAGSYACLLSGGYDPVSGAPKGQGRIDTEAILKDMGVYERFLLIRKDGRTLRSMPGFNRLVRSERQTRLGGYPGGHPFDKFYLSLDLTTPARLALGEQLFRDVVTGAQDVGALLSTKEFVHAYDALLLYTYRPHSPKIAQVLQAVYPKYRDAGLFYATSHFFQGEVRSIAPEHIGFVQEPMYSRQHSMRLGSHSQRLGRLGGYIDSLGSTLDTSLTPATFRTAVIVGRVDPARPYLVPASTP